MVTAEEQRQNKLKEMDMLQKELDSLNLPEDSLVRGWIELQIQGFRIGATLRIIDLREARVNG